MSKVNKIFLSLEIKGRGLVNFNGDRPHKRFINQMIHNGNVVKAGSFAKENVYTKEVTDSEGNVKTIDVPKKIISGNLLRKEIMGDENFVNAHKLSSIPSLRVAFLSQDNVIARGFMVVGRSISLKRKGGITVTDAEQTSDTVTWVEKRTTEGERNENSYHFRENCGEIEYQSDIIFNVKQLGFISIDDNYDRMSILESDVDGFIKHIDARYGDGNAVFGNWATTHNNVIGEQGVVLSPKVVSNIIRETIKRIFEINITRSSSYAKTKSVKIAFGYEGEDIDLLANPKYVEINSIQEYDKLVEGLEIGVDFIPIEPIKIEKIEKKPKVEE